MCTGALGDGLQGVFLAGGLACFCEAGVEADALVGVGSRLSVDYVAYEVVVGHWFEDGAEHLEVVDVCVGAEVAHALKYSLFYEYAALLVVAAALVYYYQCG